MRAILDNPCPDLLAPPFLAIPLNSLKTNGLIGFVMPNSAFSSPEAERWAQIREILSHTLALPATQRNEYVESECGADSELKAEVQSLVTASERSGMLDEPLTVNSAGERDDQPTLTVAPNEPFG